MTRFSAARIAVRTSVLVAALFAITSPAHAAPISFSLTVTDLDAPSTFNFFFSDLSGDILTGMVDVFASIDVTITDGGRDGAAVTGQLPGGFMFGGFASMGGTSLGVDIGPGCSVPAGSTAPGGGTATCSFSGSNTLLWPDLEQALTANPWFGLSGGDDKVTIVGLLTVVPHDEVPEPVGVSLLGVALAGAALRRRRQDASRS